MEIIRINVDFSNCDHEGRVRLNTIGAMQSPQPLSSRFAERLGSRTGVWPFLFRTGHGGILGVGAHLGFFESASPFDQGLLVMEQTVVWNQNMIVEKGTIAWGRLCRKRRDKDGAPA